MKKKDRRSRNGRYTRTDAARLAAAEASSRSMTRLRRMALDAGYTLVELAHAANKAGLPCSSSLLSMAAIRGDRKDGAEVRPMPRATAWFICQETGYPMTGWVRLSD